MFRKLICMSTVAVTLGISFQALADTTPEDAKDYRSAVMTSLRGHLVAVSMIARGLVPNDGQLVNHARGIVNGAMEFEHLFPAGSNVGESEALPIIWEDAEGFAAAVEKANKAAAAFAEAAESGDKEAISGAFREMGGACRGCHDRYRVAHD